MGKHVFLVFLVIIMQGTCLNNLDINGLLPNFSLVYLLYAGFFLELYTALAIAILLGLLVDLSGTFPSGTTVIIYAFLVFVINYLSTFLDFRNLTSWVLGVIIGTLLIDLSHFVIAEMIFEFRLPFKQFTINFLIQLFYNVISILLFYPLFRVSERRTQNKRPTESILEI